MSADTNRLISEFHRLYRRGPSLLSGAPGRVNLIGEHTDYNEGFVLPAAIDRTVAVAAGPRDDGIIRVQSLDYGQCDEFPVDRVRRFMGSRGWRDYVRSVAWALQDEHLDLRGADLAVTGNIPAGAGLSSSAAIELATAGALTAIAEIQVDGRRLAQICQKAENMFVGVLCGIMDQYTSALGEKGAALLIDCRSLEAEAVPLPAEVSIVIVDSKIPRDLADTAYNQRRTECAEAARALGVESLRDIDLGHPQGDRSQLGDTLFRRARHVVTENQRVQETVSALRKGRLDDVSELMALSHESLRDDFEVSTPELDVLVDIARDVDGVIGSRLTGAGFGGCTVNLVRDEAVDGFSERVVSAYEAKTGLVAEVHLCRPVSGLRVSRV